MRPDPELVGEALGHEPTAWTPVQAGGYTRSHAWRADTSDGPVFVKQAEERGSLDMLRCEGVVYRGVSGSFLPQFVGFADSGERALLAIELLEGAQWPPPYPDDVTPLLDALGAVAATRPPDELQPYGAWSPRWERVAADPAAFLGLSLCSPDWLEASLAALIAAEREADFDGTCLVHNDVYSANVAFARGGALLVDWGVARCGSPLVDAAQALLSIRVEGGKPPPSPAGVEPFVAAFAGGLAVEAPAPLPDWAAPGATLREDMKGDLAVALNWLVELLDLPPVS